jgi:polyphosphate glucokinase
MTVLGIDIGGSGIKGAPVDIGEGTLTEERYRLETPQPSDPEHVLPVLAEVVDHFPGDGPIGVTFPGVVRRGTIGSAANVDKSWLGVDAAKLFSDKTGRAVTVLNDADAAGVAEVAHGAARGVAGIVMLFTLGTGIGSALFIDGKLVPNTEFGHLELNGKEAESRASDRARELHDLSWEKWGGRLHEYLAHLEMLFSPDLIILGGGVSKKSAKFLPFVHIETPIVPAALQNNAGIVGAAMATKGV